MPTWPARAPPANALAPPAPPEATLAAARMPQPPAPPPAVILLPTAPAAAGAPDGDAKWAGAGRVGPRGGDHSEVRRVQALEGGCARAVGGEALTRRPVRDLAEDAARVVHEARRQPAEGDRAGRREAGQARQRAGDRAAADDREAAGGVSYVPRRGAGPVCPRPELAPPVSLAVAEL